MGRSKNEAITNFLAVRPCVSLSGRSYQEFSGRAFLWIVVRTELSRNFWKSVPVGRCDDGAITNFLAGRSCGSLEGLSHLEFSGRAFLWVAVTTELSRIFWQSVLVGCCKDGAITNFLAERSCGSL